MEKNKLFIRGSISDIEIKDLNNELSNESFTISKLFTGVAIGGIHDVVST